MINAATKPLLPVLVLLVFATKDLQAQNVTSPYSILGIGDVDTKDFGRYFGSGNAALARRDATVYNFSNPASLTAMPLKIMHLDVAMRGRISKFGMQGVDTLTNATKDYVFKRVSMAFKISEKTGLAFGLRPYSSVNYQYAQETSVLDGNSAYTKYIEGNGGINQVYFSAARSITKRLSAGVTASWLFGSLQRSTQYYGSAISLNIEKQETDFYNGVVFQGGIQYSLPRSNWSHVFAATGSVSTDLKGELTTVYNENGTTISNETTGGRSFRLRVMAGIGYSASNRSGFTVSAEANYYSWKKQDVNYSRSYTAPALRLSGGVEYSFKNKQWNSEKAYFSLGASAEKGYIRIRNNELWDYSVSVGGGYNIFRSLSLYTGLEIGRRGNKSIGQISENYTQFVIGLTLRDLWLGTKRYGRFN